MTILTKNILMSNNVIFVSIELLAFKIFSKIFSKFLLLLGQSYSQVFFPKNNLILKTNAS